MTKKTYSFSKRLRLLRQDYGHVALGLAGAIGSTLLAPYAFSSMIEVGWNYTAIYSAVFDVTTVFTALLFAFVVYFRTSKSAFLSALPKSLLDQAAHFSQRAFGWGMVLLFASVPLIVAEPQPSDIWQASNVVVAVWVGLALAAGAAFRQASSIFWIIVSGDR